MRVKKVAVAIGARLQVTPKLAFCAEFKDILLQRRRCTTGAVGISLKRKTRFREVFP